MQFLSLDHIKYAFLYIWLSFIMLLAGALFIYEDTDEISRSAQLPGKERFTSMQELVWIFRIVELELDSLNARQRLSSTRSRRSWAFDLEWVSDFYWLELLSVVVDDNLMLTWKLMCIHGDGILISWFRGVYQFMSVWLIFPLGVFPLAAG